jgi:hypothetical protein
MFLLFRKADIEDPPDCSDYEHYLKIYIAQVTWVCPSGTHGLVYRVRPIMEVDKYKDSNIDLEKKKEGSNPYSTRTLVKPSLVAYIKPGRDAPRETTYKLHRELEYT